MNHPAVPLRRITTCLDGRRIPLNATERSQTPGDIPYWGSGGVVDTVGDYLFDEPLVLLGEDGAPIFDTVRTVAFRTTGKVWVNNHIHVLRPFNSDPRFLTHALNAVDYSAYITGSTRDKLTQEDMNEIEVPNPPLPEQRRIADFLDDQVTRIDKAIQLRKRQAALVAERQKVVRAIGRTHQELAPYQKEWDQLKERLPAMRVASVSRSRAVAAITAMTATSSNTVSSAAPRSSGERFIMAQAPPVRAAAGREPAR